MKQIKNSKVRAIIGVIVIFIGFVFLTGGKPMPEDPNILEPTYYSLAIAVGLMLIGWLICKKHIKAYLDENLE